MLELSSIWVGQTWGHRGIPPGGEPPEDIFRRLVEAWHVVDRDDAAGARRCGGCAAYASIARPPCPSTVVVPERNASVILRSLSFCEGFGGEPAVGNAAQERDGRGEDPALVVRKRFDVG